MASKQSRPKSPLRRLTDEWRGRVEAALKETGKNRYWLARRLGSTSATVSNILKPGKQTHSRLVEPVSELLHIPLPEFNSEREQEALELLQRLRQEDPEQFDKELERIRRLLSVSSD